MIFSTKFTRVLVILLPLFSFLTPVSADLPEACKKAEEFRQNVEEWTRSVAETEAKLNEQVALFEKYKDEKHKLKERIADLHAQIKLNEQQIKEVSRAAENAAKNNDQAEVTRMRQKLAELKTRKQELASDEGQVAARLKELQQLIDPLKKEIKRLKKTVASDSQKVHRYQAQHERHKKACQQWHSQGCPTKSTMERLGKQRFNLEQLTSTGLKNQCQTIKNNKAKDLRCKPAILPPICTELCWNRVEGYAQLYRGLDDARTKSEKARKEIISSSCPRVRVYSRECPFEIHPYCR